LDFLKKKKKKNMGDDTKMTQVNGDWKELFVVEVRQYI